MDPGHGTWARLSVISEHRRRAVVQRQNPWAAMSPTSAASTPWTPRSRLPARNFTVGMVQTLRFQGDPGLSSTYYT
jgi:hypothetical protein